MNQNQNKPNENQGTSDEPKITTHQSQGDTQHAYEKKNQQQKIVQPNPTKPQHNIGQVNPQQFERTVSAPITEEQNIQNLQASQKVKERVQANQQKKLNSEAESFNPDNQSIYQQQQLTHPQQFQVPNIHQQQPLQNSNFLPNNLLIPGGNVMHSAKEQDSLKVQNQQDLQPKQVGAANLQPPVAVVGAVVQESANQKNAHSNILNNYQQTEDFSIDNQQAQSTQLPVVQEKKVKKKLVLSSKPIEITPIQQQNPPLATQTNNSNITSVNQTLNFSENQHLHYQSGNQQQNPSNNSWVLKPQNPAYVQSHENQNQSFNNNTPNLQGNYSQSNQQFLNNNSSNIQQSVKQNNKSGQSQHQTQGENSNSKSNNHNNGQTSTSEKSQSIGEWGNDKEIIKMLPQDDKKNSSNKTPKKTNVGNTIPSQHTQIQQQQQFQAHAQVNTGQQDKQASNQSQASSTSLSQSEQLQISSLKTQQQAFYNQTNQEQQLSGDQSDQNKTKDSLFYNTKQIHQEVKNNLILEATQGQNKLQGSDQQHDSLQQQNVPSTWDSQSLQQQQSKISSVEQQSASAQHIKPQDVKTERDNSVLENSGKEKPSSKAYPQNSNKEQNQTNPANHPAEVITTIDKNLSRKQLEESKYDLQLEGENLQQPGDENSELATSTPFTGNDLIKWLKSQMNECYDITQFEELQKFNNRKCTQLQYAQKQQKPMYQKQQQYPNNQGENNLPLQKGGKKQATQPNQQGSFNKAYTTGQAGTQKQAAQTNQPIEVQIHRQIDSEETIRMKEKIRQSDYLKQIAKMKQNPKLKLEGLVRFELNKLTLTNYDAVTKSIQNFLTDPNIILELVKDIVRKENNLSRVDQFTNEQEDVINKISIDLQNNFLETFVKLFLQKSIQDEKFIPIYAKMCVTINNDSKNKNKKDQKSDKATFRNEFYGKLQNTFEDKEGFKIKELKTQWSEMNQMSQEVYQRDWKKALKNLIKLIGELFHEKFVSKKVVRIVTSTLLNRYLNDFNKTSDEIKKSHEDWLEAILELFDKIGKKFEEQEFDMPLNDKKKQEENTTGVKKNLEIDVGSQDEILVNKFCMIREQNQNISEKGNPDFNLLSLNGLFQIFEYLQKQKHVSSRLDALIKNLRERKDNKWPEKQFQDKIMTMDELHSQHFEDKEAVEQRAKDYDRKERGGYDRNKKWPQNQAPQYVRKDDKQLVIDKKRSSNETSKKPEKLDKESLRLKLRDIKTRILQQQQLQSSVVQEIAELKQQCESDSVFYDQILNLAYDGTEQELVKQLTYAAEVLDYQQVFNLSTFKEYFDEFVLNIENIQSDFPQIKENVAKIMIELYNKKQIKSFKELAVAPEGKDEDEDEPVISFQDTLAKNIVKHLVKNDPYFETQKYYENIRDYIEIVFNKEEKDDIDGRTNLIFSQYTTQ